MFQILDEYSYLWGAVMILLGIFLCFLGNRFVNVVLFTVVTLGVFLFLGSLVFYNFLDKISHQWAQWCLLALVIVLAILAGYFVCRTRKLGVALLGAWGGVMLGFVLTTTFVVGTDIAYYLIIIACALVCFFIAFKLETAVIITVTGFVGGYAIVRGISLYAGGFPNESELHDMIIAGVVDWSNFDKLFYVYLGAIVVLTGVGIYFQRKHEQKKGMSYGLKRPIL